MNGPTTRHVEAAVVRLHRYADSIVNVEAKLDKATKANDAIAEAGAREDLQRLHTEAKTIAGDLKAAGALIATLNL